MLLERSQSMTPVNFFHLRLSCQSIDSEKQFPRINGRNRKTFVLPDTSILCHEEHFSDVSMGWSKTGIEFYFEVAKSFEYSSYPEITRGDSIEIFIDTRDVKTSGYNTRFCHHFFFLPEPIEGHQMGEVTHFRTDDAHELCKPENLLCKTKLKTTSYSIHAWIPRECLHGYDPEQFNSLGFSYRINRPRWESQHFSVVSEDFKIEEQPSLWSSVRLMT